MQVEQYYSDDYAGLVSGKYHFYFGYEKTIINDDGDELWCFTVNENNNEIFRKTNKDIENNIDRDWQLNDVRDYLIAGIGMWLLLK